LRGGDKKQDASAGTSYWITFTVFSACANSLAGPPYVSVAVVTNQDVPNVAAVRHDRREERHPLSRHDLFGLHLRRGIFDGLGLDSLLNWPLGSAIQNGISSASASLD
jgi:hypothetical protein